MAEFQWWLLLVGLVAGGGIVAVVMTDGRRRDADVGELERRAEATWITQRLSGGRRSVDPGLVEAVLGAHREYLTLPPPDELVIVGDDGGVVDGEAASAPELIDDLDRDPDQVPDQVRDDRRRSADEDLART